MKCKLLFPSLSFSLLLPFPILLVTDPFPETERSFGLAIGGAYAEFIKTPTSMLTLKPSHVSWVQAAAVPENWLTAFQALFTISEFRKGQTCLIHAGCSGVGLAAIQLAKAYGA